MGIREDQYYGLSERGRELVEGEQVLLYHREEKRYYPDGRVEKLNPQPVYGSSVRKEKIGTLAGAWCDVVALLYRYVLPDGTVYTESIQAVPWSSGPCYFIALRDEVGNWVPESFWTDKEAREYGFHPLDLRPD